MFTEYLRHKVVKDNGGVTLETSLWGEGGAGASFTNLGDFLKVIRAYILFDPNFPTPLIICELASICAFLPSSLLRTRVDSFFILSLSTFTLGPGTFSVL